MITLTLLHPIQSTPVQHWTFEHDPVIRIGRSTDNHVILYSAVVSRHHVELRRLDNGNWEIISLGANGTYLDGKQIAQVPVLDGIIIRLARSGPKIQIHQGASPNGSAASSNSVGSRSSTKVTAQTGIEAEAEADLQPPAATSLTKTDIDEDPSISTQSTSTQSTSAQSTSEAAPANKTLDEADFYAPVPASEMGGSRLECTHAKASADMAFCPDCGQPLRIVQVLGSYQVLKTLTQDRLGVTQLIWRDGQTLLLKALNAGVDQSGEVQKLFEARARSLLKLNHPALPRFVDYFVSEGRSCLVIEKVYGQDLYQLVATKGTLSEADAIALILQVCDALDYLHQQSPPVLHLDLRPENLVYRASAPPESSVILAGFVSLQTLKMDTQSAVIGYQAPEQHQGHTLPATDLFALGPILVYLITGKEPGQFYAHREQGFRFYPEYVPGLSPDVVAVVRRLTSPNPAERYVNAGEVAIALSQIHPATTPKL